MLGSLEGPASTGCSTAARCAPLRVTPIPRSTSPRSPERALVSAFTAGRARVVHAGADWRAAGEARYGRELWSWFIVIALVLLVAETIIARAGMGSRVPEPAGQRG